MSKKYVASKLDYNDFLGKFAVGKKKAKIMGFNQFEDDSQRPSKLLKYCGIQLKYHSEILQLLSTHRFPIETCHMLGFFPL